MDAKDLLEQIKINHKKLDGCLKHDFSIDLNPERKMGKRYRCTNCGGEVNSIDKHWYEKGLKHANN